MKVFRTLAGVSLLCLATAQAAQAGAAYVPLPGVGTVGPVTYETQITITNTAGQQRTVNYLQLASEADGTSRRGLNPTPLQIAGGRTSVLRPSSNTRGLLELNGPGGFQYSARLVGTGNAAGLGVELPVITSNSIGSPDGELVLQGLRSAGSRTTDLVLVNLGHNAASCTVNVVRADGTLAFPAATLSLLPLSHRFFPNIFGAFPEGVADARAEVTCTNSFFAYAQMTDSATGEFAIVTPSGASDSNLTVPGEVTGLSCTAGTVCYTFPGLVHHSTNSNPDHTIVLTPPLAAYSSVKVRLDVTIGPWNQPTRAAHGILYFIRNRNKDMYANIFLRGPGGDNVTLRHGFEQAHGDKAKIEKGFKAQPGETYTFEYEFNPVQKRIFLTISQDGQVVASLSGQPNVRRVHIEQGDKVIIGLSNPGITPVEPASIGWRYQNLKVEFIP
jgi:translation initiation factor IF-1